MPNQEQQLKQILAQVIEVNSGDEPLAEQDIETLFNKKFEEEGITKSRETWRQLDEILRHGRYREFIEPKSGEDKQYTLYTALVALVIDKNIEERELHGPVSMPEARQCKARSARSNS